MLFNVVDGIGDSALVYDYVVRIEEYRLLGALNYDIYFKEELEDVLKYYQRFNEETLSNISPKLATAAEKTYIRELEYKLLLSIDRYCGTVNIDDITSRVQATEYLFHAINSESFLKLVKEVGDFPRLYKRIGDALIFGPMTFSILFMCYFAYKYGLNSFSNECYIGGAIFLSGFVFGSPLNYLLAKRGRLVNLKSYLQELQNKFHLSAEAMKKHDLLEKKKEIVNNVQKVLLEKRVPFSDLEKLFNVVDREKEPVYDYKPSLTFGKEQ